VILVNFSALGPHPQRSSLRDWPSALRAAALAAGSALIYVFRFDLEDPRRWLVALATLGFFFAPLSDQPLRAKLWLLGVAGVGWAVQIAGSGRGGFALWLATSVAAALLVVRGGSRAARYYLPPASGDEGFRLQRRIRTQLQISVVLFLGGYLSDRALGSALVVLSAVFFVRYVLLQSKSLGIGAAALSIDPGIVFAQRWPVVVLFGVLASDLPGAMPAEARSSLLLTATLLLVTAALLFTLSLTRTDWPRSFVRRASFAAGIYLAVGLTAVLVEMESWDRARYRLFASLCIAFLVVLPFLARETRLLASYPRFSAVAPSPALAVMLAPITAIAGVDEASSTAIFLLAFCVIMIGYYLLLSGKRREGPAPYLGVNLGLTLYLFLAGGGDRSWQVFAIAFGALFYAIDRVERAWRESRPRERISAS
jgi:hypothetical protein